MTQRPTAPRHRQRGLSLIELMVALVIGMVLTLAVFSVLSAWEGRKRVTTTLGDLNQAGNLALYQLDLWVRSAGSGFTSTQIVATTSGASGGSYGDSGAYGCRLYAKAASGQTLPRTSALPAPFASVDLDGSGNFPLVPVMIIPGATTPEQSGQSSDGLLVMVGQHGFSGANLSMAAAPAAATLKFDNTLPFAANDLLVLSDPSLGSSPKKCLLTQVSSSFSSSDGSATSLPLGGDFYASSVDGVSVASSFSADSGMVLPIGNTKNPPQFLLLGVGDNNTLYSYDLLQLDGSASALEARAEGVFEMHALYGVDTDADGTIDAWKTAASTGDYSVTKLMAGTATARDLLKRIKAIRVGLILRQTLSEKSVDDTSTPETLSLFKDLGGSLQVDRSLTADERKYRYRTAEATLVLRGNLMIKD